MLLQRFLAAGTVLVALPLCAHRACAHEGVGHHGGRLADAGPYHVELVTKDRRVEVWVYDAKEKAVSPAGFKGTAILVVGGKPARVVLAPAEARLTGEAEVALGATPKGVVQITGPDGAAASGKFN
ncbi:hypothetical protein [Methylobacterium platani]|uniref:Uncharacterized protein n=2 Tax=Methylobacterium platani TaxID=427683 RepID=A0A179S3X6_9HYPH|nr:hypothetical protein [Methylobacterium platani]KMO15759.1 hypothetical protein SQ03_16520 [Methylobacterium platani JCM 14648]OAS19561.1 hypothetical protein A5481_24405 [Methylobacterium platani]